MFKTKKNKKRSSVFSFVFIGVQEEHMKPENFHLNCKLVSTSSERLILGHYKGAILDYDVLCVQRLKRNM